MMVRGGCATIPSKPRKSRRRFVWKLLLLFILGTGAALGVNHYIHPHERLLVLVLGVDERADEVGVADTVMLVALDPDRRAAGVFSIPRDTYVRIPGIGYDKLNHAYSFGGEPLVLRTVQALLDIPIDHFATVNFDGFRQVIDALGGVRINVEKPMHYEDTKQDLVIDLQPGRQLLSGSKALEYARFRADEEGDPGRVRRQQELLRALKERALRPETAWRLPFIASALARSVRTDLPVSHLAALVTRGRVLSGMDPAMGTAAGDHRILGGVDYYIPDVVETRIQAYQTLFNAPLPAAARQGGGTVRAAMEESLAQTETLSARTALRLARGRDVRPVPPVGLVDASGADLLQPVSALLRQEGYRLIGIKRTKVPRTETVIIDYARRPDMVEELRRLFPGARAEVPDRKGPHLVVQLGRQHISRFSAR